MCVFKAPQTYTPVVYPPDIPLYAPARSWLSRSSSAALWISRFRVVRSARRRSSETRLASNFSSNFLKHPGLNTFIQAPLHFFHNLPSASCASRCLMCLKRHSLSSSLFLRKTSSICRNSRSLPPLLLSCLLLRGAGPERAARGGGMAGGGRHHTHPPSEDVRRGRATHTPTRFNRDPTIPYRPKKLES